MKMPLNTLRIIRFIILVVAIVSFMQVLKNNNSILFAVTGIIAALILFFSRVTHKKN